MAELYGASKLFVGMTATLINGYSSGIFTCSTASSPGLCSRMESSMAVPAILTRSTVWWKMLTKQGTRSITPTGVPVSENAHTPASRRFAAGVFALSAGIHGLFVPVGHGKRSAEL